MSVTPRIYHAEHMIRTTFDRYHAGAQIIIHGVPLVLPVEKTFTTITEIDQYVQQMLTSPEITSIYGELMPVRVRGRKGKQAAHYEPGHNTIAIPIETQWAARELVVIHEIAHHIRYHTHTRSRHTHDQKFLDTYLDCLNTQLGEHTHFLALTTFIYAGIWNRKNSST